MQFTNFYRVLAMKIPEFNPTAGIPKTSYGPKSGGPTFDNATWFSTVRPTMNETRPGVADSDVNCYQEMDENNPIYQAIDRSGGWECDIPAILRELNKSGFVIVPKEPSDSMLAAALQSSLDMMKECGVDGLSPFEDYPSPAEVTKRAYRAMIRAVE